MDLIELLRALMGIIYIVLQAATWIIIIQAILSWLVAFNVINLSNDFVRTVLTALDRITEPMYRPIRRIMPDLGALDLSPMVVLLTIMILQQAILPNLFALLARVAA
ncbi:YggT family protein [Sphingobium aromaticiconvertens]|uniref:YggT family protein n=1 Tax=Sphingobium aromaticiconvertens TaxID=365341 RepID=UPI003AFA8F93